MATKRLPFQSLLQLGFREGTTPFPGLLHFTLDTYLILLSVNQGGIKYHFLSLWYDDLGLKLGLLDDWRTLYPQLIIGVIYDNKQIGWVYILIDLFVSEIHPPTL